jgi:RNA polymerase sigma-70 factor (ECF subfamily)
VLFERYGHLVSALCLKYLKNQEEAKDAAMEVFEKLHQNIQKAEISYFKSWLYTVVKNYCLMKLRKAGINTISEDNIGYSLDNQLQWSESPDAIFNENDSRLERLNPCMEQLKTEQRECIDLFFLQEKSYKEIMSITLFDYNSVKSFIQNGRTNLKKCLER